MSNIHKIKVHSQPLADVISGIKKAEFRLNDRGYEVNDILWLEEYIPNNNGTGKYTGKSTLRVITHIQEGYGIPKDFMMLSLGAEVGEPLTLEESNKLGQIKREPTWMEAKLLTEQHYRPYCGNNDCARMPRANWSPALSQFHCPWCGWTSAYSEQFIQDYKKKWNL